MMGMGYGSSPLRRILLYKYESRKGTGFSRRLSGSGFRTQWEEIIAGRNLQLIKWRLGSLTFQEVTGRHC